MPDKCTWCDIPTDGKGTHIWGKSIYLHLCERCFDKLKKCADVMGIPYDLRKNPLNED